MLKLLFLLKEWLAVGYYNQMMLLGSLDDLLWTDWWKLYQSYKHLVLHPPLQKNIDLKDWIKDSTFSSLAPWIRYKPKKEVASYYRQLSTDSKIMILKPVLLTEEPKAHAKKHGTNIVFFILLLIENCL